METVCFFLKVSNVLKRCSHVAIHFETFTQICVNPISSRDISFQVVGWVGTSNNLLRNLCFTRPGETPSLLYRSEPCAGKLWSSRLRHLPQSIAEKRFVVLQQLSFDFVISFKRHSVYVYGTVSRFYDTPVWASRFYRSLCYVVCVHGLLSLE